MKKRDTIDILIIDNSAADARLLQLMLKDQGHLIGQITIEPTIQSALNKQLEQSHQIILVDVGLFKKSKLTQLLTLTQKTDAYTIAISGANEKELTIEALNAGAEDFWVKGRFTSEELLDKIEFAQIKYHRKKQLVWAQRMNLLAPWSYDATQNQVDLSHATFFLNKAQISFLALQIEAAIRDALTGKIWEKEILYTLAGNDDLLKEKKYFLLTIERFEGKTLPQTIKGTIQDISERKKAKELLEETHQKYIDIFANSSDGIYLSTILGHPKECNKSGMEIFGIQDNEIANSNLHHFFDRKNGFAVLGDIGHKKAIKNREIEIIRKDGSIRNCLISVVYFSDESDMYTGILRDITERKIAEKIKRTRLLEVESNQLKEQFIAAISHEMRTPMNAIIGLSNLLLDTTLNDEQRGYLKSIHHSSEQLLGILNDILDISSLKNGQIIFENKNFDIHDLLHNIVHNLSYKVPNKDLVIELAIDSELPRILKGDKLRINQILYNLAGNAVKFTDKGSVKINCSLLGQSGDTVLIKFSIADTGIGIPKEKQDAIFESFARIKHKERIFEGTGLGLAISKNLIEQQGGKIWVTSKLGEGSTFFFDLVLEIGDDVQPQNEKETISETVIVNPKRIMIVEDNKMNQLVARKLLAKRWPELDIIVANNGQEALDLIDEDFDVILMDLYMPVMDGYAATKALRNHENPNIQALPILAMTADAQIQEGDKYLQYDLDGFIVKPFDPGLLYEKILSHLNRTHAKL